MLYNDDGLAGVARMMKRVQLGIAAMVLLLAMPGAQAQFAGGALPATSALQIPKDHLIEPQALNAVLKAGKEKPVLLQVGSRVMFDQAHIPGSIYAGPGSQAAGLELLASKVASTPKSAPIVIYCGCCPWTRCPNMEPAYERLRQMGFTNVKALYIANNFGSDWVDKGFSVEKGE